jgi:translation initiation factor IF-3
LIRPPFLRNNPSSTPFTRVNGKIRAREVRVIGEDGSQVGVLPIQEALSLARSRNVDLVEVAPNANPPVCRLIDYGKYRYEQSKKDKESARHQHANKVKEIQLSPTIDPHDFTVKLNHAVDFLSEEMKVKITLRFRGREMAHQEYGFQQVNRFIAELQPFGHPDAQPKLIGRGINVMISPLPRNKRAKNPRQPEDESHSSARPGIAAAGNAANSLESTPSGRNNSVPMPSSISPKSEGFSNNPFSQLDRMNSEDNGSPTERQA